jgi:hypothetical protein
MTLPATLALVILDGPRKGNMLSLRNEAVFCGGYFSDEEMGNKHAGVFLDQNLSWNIRALDKNKIRIGLDETDRISLILGLVFHLGQTGFKVIEKPKLRLGGWEEGLTDWLNEQSWEEQKTEFFFFRHPVQMTFLTGPQTNEFFTISYGPRVMGFNCFDLNIKDPTVPKKLVRFYQVGETAYIEKLSIHEPGYKVLVNKNQFDHHAISPGDRLQFGQHLLELTLLK